MSVERLIGKDTPVIEVLENYPAAAKVFAEHGMDCAHCMGADVETVGETAVMHGVDLAPLLDALNAACAESGQAKDEG